MVRKAYTDAEKREAVALARVAGAEHTSAELGIDRRTIVGWMTDAGAPPPLEGEAGVWQRLFDAATAKVEAAIATGRMKPAQAVTVAAVASRNLERVRDRGEPEVPLALDVREPFLDWLVDTVADTDWDPAVLSDDDLDTEFGQQLSAALHGVIPALLRAANAEQKAQREAGQLTGEHNGPHRKAILAWFHGEPQTPDFQRRPDRPMAEAGDIIEWAQGIVRGWLEEHTTLRAWHAAEIARKEREQLVAARTWVLFKDGGTPFPEAQRIAEEITT